MAKTEPAKPQLSGGRLKKTGRGKSLKKLGWYCLALAVLIVAAALYYTKVYSDPQRTFWSMIDNNLSSNGVTKRATQQGFAGTTESITQLVFNPASRVHYIKKITDKTTNPSSHLTLEGIGTPKADYQRYSHIDRPGNKADYSSIYDLWLKGDQPALFGNTVLGAILFGNISQPQRGAVISKLRDAYQVRPDTADKQSDKRLHTYSVNINLQKYALAARAYAKALGLPNADKITPNSYQANATAQIVVSVDIPSRQLTKIEYKNSQVTEIYTSYGVASVVASPKETVNNQQFQRALSSVKE